MLRILRAQNADYPSWIGLVQDSPFGAPTRLSGRLNGESLVGHPGKKTYNASRRRAPKVHFGTSDSTDTSTIIKTLQGLDQPISPSSQHVPSAWDTYNARKASAKDRFDGESRGDFALSMQEGTASPAPADHGVFENTSQRRSSGKEPLIETALFTGTLYAKGVILRRISRVSSRVVDGTISDDCLAMAGWKAGDDVNNISDCLWRTLVADRAADGTSAPFWYRRACMDCLHKASPDGDLNTSKLLANRSLPETVLEYLKRVQSVVWSRKFFICRESKNRSRWLFGLGSRYIEDRDIVCILFGCSVPVVL
jgi:hypothetical protein